MDAISAQLHGSCFRNIIFLRKAIIGALFDNFDGNLFVCQQVLTKHDEVAAAFIEHTIDLVLINLARETLLVQNGAQPLVSKLL